MYYKAMESNYLKLPIMMGKDDDKDDKKGTIKGQKLYRLSHNCV